MRNVIAEALSAHGRGSQTRLATAIGVTPQTVNKWVHGQTAPEMERWGDIEVALELAPGTLRHAAGLDIRGIMFDVTPPHDAADPAADTMTAVLDAVRQLDASMQRLEGRIRALEQRLDPTSRPPAPSTPAREPVVR